MLATVGVTSFRHIILYFTKVYFLCHLRLRVRLHPQNCPKITSISAPCARCCHETPVQTVPEHSLWDVQECQKAAQCLGGCGRLWWARSLSPGRGDVKQSLQCRKLWKQVWNICGSNLADQVAKLSLFASPKNDRSGSWTKSKAFSESGSIRIQRSFPNKFNATLIWDWG